MTRNVVDRDGIFHSETMGLALNTRTVNEDACIGIQTRECQADMVIQYDRLANGAGVLELLQALSLNTQYGHVFAADTDLIVSRGSYVQRMCPCAPPRVRSLPGKDDHPERTQ